ncbi:hypothetical protein RHMOL_Rhmol11G0055700 [Rhododendron molle]|uniref:Uncharacterized protein n=1 Tax=Rhododendron molle TaxID=49168 RepID=A0ACC0LPT1_RHOML|nr:hypothetical protein RHMOL_Rhmol11G0055700 [Rhododendron molle]
MQSYTIWHKHGEPRILDKAQHHFEMNSNEDRELGGIDALVEDQIRGDSTNTNPNEEVQREHKNMLPIRAGENITHKQRKEFPKWFKDHMNRLRVEESPEATDELWSLANGPNLLVKEYSGCIINGVRFHKGSR